MATWGFHDGVAAKLHADYILWSKANGLTIDSNTTFYYSFIISYAHCCCC